MMSRALPGTSSVSLLLVAAIAATAIGCGSEGGTTSGSGGRSGGSGGAPAGTGGAAAGSGGAAAGSGGAAAGTGGAMVGTGGAAAGTGGSAPGTGGAVPGTGGFGGGSGGGGGGAAGAGNGGSAGSASGGAAGGGGGAAAFVVTTPAFMNQAGCGPGAMASSCGIFPRDNTSYGMNISPAMTWTGAPAGTQSFAVLLQDLTNGMAHWVLWNIPASVTMLAANVPKTSAMPAMPAGSQQSSYAANEGYAGPGACGNVYEFVVYALAVPTFSPTMATNQTMVRMQLQNLGASILGMATMRARSFMPNCP